MATSKSRREKQRHNRRMKRYLEEHGRLPEGEDFIKPKPREEYISYYNHERYSDPVACAAINSVVRERRRTHV